MPLEPGAVVGRYRIAHRLGHGGMGEVYRAHDLALKRDVALKIIAEKSIHDPAALRRFAREALAASALNHPNIVSVFDVGECELGPFIVMELVDGQTLREVLDAGPALDSAVAVVRQLARALSVAHDAGIVHRDVKPDNVMVRDDGYAKVLDFGLARTAVRDAVAPGGGSDAGTGRHVLGTARYMSPEQARGLPAGSPSDVFSMGVVLYEIATGRHPFGTEETASTLARIVTETPLAPSRLNPDVPSRLNTLVLDMLEKEPGRRPSAADVDRRLSEAVADHRPAPAPAPQSPRNTVGHESLRSVLAEALDRADKGQGQLVVLSGEPGIGKTTLAEDFAAAVRASGRACVIGRGRCSERLGSAGAYLPWLEVLESLRDETGQTAFRAMKTLAPAWFAQVAPLAPEDVTDSLLMSVGQSGSTEWMKRELTTFLEEVSSRRPLLILLDDVHWADQSTADLIGHLGVRLPSMRVLIVATCRPLDPKGANQSFLPIKLDLQARGVCRDLSLAFLGAHDIERFLALEFPGHAFPGDFAKLVHARTEGNPLFLVGLLQRLTELGAMVKGDGGVWRLVQSVSDIKKEIPESVRSLIELKIGGLSDADRNLLVAASVLGSEFDAAVAARALSMDQLEAEDRLEALWRAHQLVQPVREVVLGDGSVSARYRFVHVLYHDALYLSLGPSRRVALSAAAANALLAACGEHPESRASELALLFEAARDFSRAADHFLVACERARAVFAEREAVLLARRALDMLGALPNTPARDAVELRFLQALVGALNTFESYRATELAEVYERGRLLCERLGDNPGLLPILFSRGAFHFLRGEVFVAAEIAQRAGELADQTGDDFTALFARWGFGSVMSHIGGQLEKAQAMLSDGASRYRVEIHGPASAATGFDPGIGCHFHDGRVLWLLGYPDRAVARVEEARALARRSGNPLMLGFSAFFVAWIRQYRREAQFMVDPCREGSAIAEQYGFGVMRAWFNAIGGWLDTRSGRPKAGAERLQGVLVAVDQLGAGLMKPLFLALLADALAADGRKAEALQKLDEAREVAGRTGERYYLPEIHRQTGELLLGDAGDGAGDEAPVDDAFDRAVAVAREQCSRSYELRALTTRARWWRERARGPEAARELASVLATFTEGFDTPDYRDAQAEVDAVGVGRPTAG